MTKRRLEQITKRVAWYQRMRGLVHSNDYIRDVSELLAEVETLRLGSSPTREESKERKPKL